MTTPNEYTLVEKPIIEALGRMTPKYHYIRPDRHPFLRDRENEVLFKPILIQAIRRINNLELQPALSIYDELAGLTDNKRWLEILRGHYSKKLPGEETHRTIRVIDFDHIEKNEFAVTNQLRVQGVVVRKPDLVVYVNGIPLVVIEAKSPTNASQSAFDTIDQVRSACAASPGT